MFERAQAPASSRTESVMTRVILTISGLAAAHRPHPFAAVAHAFGMLWHRMAERSVSYRPERHYMRGPGPAWRAKHGSTASA